MREVRWAAGAATEFVEAAGWYEGREKGLGAERIAEVNARVEFLRSTPERFPVWRQHAAFHRALLDRFPYALFYRFTDDQVFVFALSHTSREPGYWLRRATGPTST